MNSEDVISLGNQLVKELDLEDSVDTLGRWMAHRLAELLNRLEKASDGAKDATYRECADLVIKLWNNRASLPMNHRPLESFDSILEAIKKLRGNEPFYYNGLHRGSDKKISKEVEEWLKIAENVDKFARDLVEECLNNAIAHADEEEKIWLNKGLKLSCDKDNHAQVILELIKGLPTKEGEENHQSDKISHCFREFGEKCIEIANQISSSVNGK